MDNLTLSEFWDVLNAHDWFHSFSDDGRVDRKGAENYRKIVKMCGTNYERGKMLVAFEEYTNGLITGKPVPKPERPSKKEIDESNQF